MSLKRMVKSTLFLEGAFGYTFFKPDSRVDFDLMTLLFSVSWQSTAINQHSAPANKNDWV